MRNRSRNQARSVTRSFIATSWIEINGDYAGLYFLSCDERTRKVLSALFSCPSGSIVAQDSNVLRKEQSRCSSDVLDSRRRIYLELAPPFPKEEFDGCKISFINFDVLFKLASACSSASKLLDTSQVGYIYILPRKRLEVLTVRLRLFTAFAKTLPIEGKNFFLKPRQTHCGIVQARKVRRIERTFSLRITPKNNRATASVSRTHFGRNRPG